MLPLQPIRLFTVYDEMLCEQESWLPDHQLRKMESTYMETAVFSIICNIFHRSGRLLLTCFKERVLVVCNISYVSLEPICDDLLSFRLIRVLLLNEQWLCYRLEYGMEKW